MGYSARKLYFVVVPKIETNMKTSGPLLEYDHRINLRHFMPGGKGWARITPGPRALTMAASSAPSLAVFGGAGLFFTSSWFGKNVLEQIPIYKAKYAEKGPD